jgi:hypothetical protein
MFIRVSLEMQERREKTYNTARVWRNPMLRELEEILAY